MLAHATTRTLLIILLGMTLFGGTMERAAAQEEPAAKPVDIEAGKKVAKTCAGCHGAKGISTTAGIPHLAGQHADYMLMALQAYADGSRAGEDFVAMQNVAAKLSNEDMANVAAYFESLPSFTAVAPKDKEKAAAFDAGAEEDPAGGSFV